MENILVQNENFFYIIYASHSKNMCTKYGRSRDERCAYNEHGRLGRPPSKSRTADSLLFEF